MQGGDGEGEGTAGAGLPGSTPAAAGTIQHREHEAAAQGVDNGDGGKRDGTSTGSNRNEAIEMGQ